MEKGLASTRAATKQSSLEALLLYIELDKADPIIEDLLPGLSNKQPKIIAASLAAFTAIYHAYGVKIVDPKPVLKALPKVFGHADKNVRAEASNLVVELYRWLREAIKTLFWNDLKTVQQQDLEKLFEAVKQEPPPKQEKLLRSQQVAVEKAAVQSEEAYGDGQDAEDVPAEIDAFDLAEPVDVAGKIPKDLYENLASTKWKDRKEALDAFYAVANVDRIKDGSFDEVVASLAKCMKDANIAVVTVAANCVEVLAKGLRKSFAKYRGRIMSPMMERLKEKKQSVADALGAALDAVFASTGLSDCLEEILGFLKHKNPQVKLETLRFLIRCLKTTREAPEKAEVKSIAEAATKLLTESTEVTRSGGAEILGTLMKIMGERAMNPYVDGLDDIRKTKIKECFDAAEVKAKDRPKPAAPPPKAAPPIQKKVLGKKPASGARKPAPRPSTPVEELLPPPITSVSKPGLGRAVPSKLAGPPKSIYATAPTGALKLQKRLAGPPSAPNVSSPRRNITSTPPPDEEPPPAPKLSLGGRGLAGRPLGKPVTTHSESAVPTTSTLSPLERVELEELRTENARLLRQIEELRTSQSRLTSSITELQNQNAQLIEDHTRDVLSIKAKETQLVRARSDAETAEQLVQKHSRELERLRRELSRATLAASPPPSEGAEAIYRDNNIGNGSANANAVLSGVDRYESDRVNREVGYQRARSYMRSPSDEKENGGLDGGKVKMASPPLTGREGGSPARREGGEPIESWKRAQEVTSQLKARIEMMKVRRSH